MLIKLAGVCNSANSIVLRANECFFKRLGTMSAFSKERRSKYTEEKGSEICLMHFRIRWTLSQAFKVEIDLSDCMGA